MKPSVFTRVFLVLALALALGFSLAAPEVLAQTSNDALAGLDTVGTGAGLSAEEPSVIVARIIRAGLGVLGLVALVILIYGGFLWMTAGGSEEQVNRAKKLIINAGVGVAIILTALVITQFILSALISATTGGDGGSVTDDDDDTLGGSSSNVFSVTRHQPTGQVAIRNVVAQITFSKTLDEASVTESSIQFVYADGDVEIPGTLEINGNRVSFTPATPCPDPNSDRFCFKENALVEVTVDKSVKSSSGTVLSCTNNLCNSSFTTGTLIDTENPEARLELPDDGAGVPSDSLVDVQVGATDDAQVSVADFAASDVIFDSVPATGDDLTDVLISTVWDTAGLLNGSSYRLTATVIDIAGNTDADSVTVDVRPQTCFNNVIDGIETGLNCGGDSTSTDYCGACDGSSCSSNDECSSGVCQNGICVSLPTIDGISPPGGIPGTWVTLSGRHFGNAVGSVTFIGATGPVTAELATCEDAWTNTQIIVVVPQGAVDGPITVITAAGQKDSTFDDNGKLIVDFDVNDTEHPGVCSVTPDEAAVSDAVTIIGASFGGDRKASTVTFDDIEAGSYNAWSSTSAEVTVPPLPDGDYAVAVTVDGSPSNTVHFTVASETTDAPVITTLTPNTGGKGQYVTISGTNFNTGVGTVWFENVASQERFLADTESFPDACADDFWSNQEITVIVPNDIGQVGAYNVIVATGGQESNAVPFTLTNAAPTPGLCAIDPPNALASDTVTLHGDNFGGNQGVVTFSAAQSAEVQDWSDGEIVVTVPARAVTGSVVAESARGEDSNPVNFEVSASDTGSGAGALAAYAWSFSSGLIPDAPEMIFECSEEMLSGVPNDAFDNQEGVCVNASVFAAFTLPMNQASLNSGSLEECIGGGNNPCNQTRQVPGEYYTTSRSVLFDPDNDLRPSTTYLVTATDGMMSVDGTPLANPSEWTFTTRADTTLCRVENVVVAPEEATIRELYGKQDFTSVPVQGCTVLNDPNLHWSWAVSPSYARFDTMSDEACQAGDSTCALVEALAEGVTPVRATETTSSIFDEATLTIDFSDPYVTNYWPNCTEACVNAEVGASFNTAMSEAALETAGAVRLYRCSNELCTGLSPIVSARVACSYDAEGECTGFNFTNLTLTPLSFYRVIIDGAVMSTSGVALTRTNYAGDFSWTFRVREDASLCAVDRIALSPAAVTVDQVGTQRTFTGEAYGEADSCSVSGQRLSGYAYEWDWTDPIPDEDNDNDADTHVAEWKPGLVDTDVSSVAIGCTTSCTAAGSMPQAAICGDGAIDFGEECEDGNVANGDGCSASCLREGNPAASCGNGVVNRLPSGAGEDCDNGKQCDDGLACSSDADCANKVSCRTRDGDGCSSLCLAEGSSSIGATCGNNDRAVTSPTGLAGEECDDGNAARGDGCSNECLFEGSPTLTEIGGAVCGDGSLERPTEQCEDGNTANGDGCSSRCLWEGSSASYGSTCGTGGIQYGEACDDGDSDSGDGCSSDCLLEGSSTLYAEPSFCGDGVTGIGEAPDGEVSMCESGVAGDGRIDPLQVAFVPNEAVLEVDPVTQQAVATIEVTEVDSGLTTEATLSLLCSAENDTQCSDSARFGAGVNNCCMARPEVLLFPNANGVCRNSAVYAEFTQEMDVADFMYETAQGEVVTRHRMYARLDLSTTADGLCPSDHMRLAVEPRNFALRIWNTLVRLVTGQSARAAADDCVAPIEGFEQVQTDVGVYKVKMRLGALLVANATYDVVVEGDDYVGNDEVTGVRTKLGVGLNGTRYQTFTVGNEVCALDAVNVLDTDERSPYVFTVGDEQHNFVATAESYSGGIPQEIASIPGVYSWTWSGWEAENNDEIVNVEQVATALDSATVTATGENGDDTVFATANIRDNTSNIPSESAITGSAAILAFLCENPWPGTFSQLPWSDTADGDIGAEVGSGWMNFSTMYCRDQGEEGDAEDLAEVIVVRPPVSESNNVIKEYLYEVGSSDAIGVRIVSNSDYLSPQEWYESQGFTGSPTETEVNGYKAVKDGRTTYVVAPNQADDGDLYTNVYVISYNEGASDETIDIYNQMVENFKFAVNVDGAALCADDDEVCTSQRGYLRRDTRRLIDLTDTRAAIVDYRALNGTVPTLPSGTFVRSLSSSVWESWKSILAGGLGATLSVDPINDYVTCGGPGYEAFDAETCVNELNGTYVCPLNSHAYHYKAVGDTESFVYADLEYTAGSWFYPLEEDAADGVTLIAGNANTAVAGFEAGAFCDGGSTYGLSTTCGDGVVGGLEICELGQAGGEAVACTTTDGLSGTRSQTCNASCDGFTDDVAATCVVASCGNGVIEIDSGELCDDGSLNGTYGFCGGDCRYASAFFCGDGELAGGEACDCGLNQSLNSSDSRAYGAGAGSCGNNLNGVYANSPNGSCAWDCSGPAPYCGDGTLDSGEVCDGTDATWDGKLCSQASPRAYRNQPCSTNADCGTGGVCGVGAARAACPVGTTRVKTCQDNPGESCTYNANNWLAIWCSEIGSCGDGVLDPGEACDDGNTDGTDSCTDQCQANVCGDGYVYVGEEQCDEATNNGAACDSAYGSSCTSCSVTCRYEVTSGEFCGDGEINGNEYCDANSILPVWYDAAKGEMDGSCTTLNATHPNNSDFVCKNVGVCNGGGVDNNGTPCLNSNQCGSGTCVFPTCSQSCGNTCPFTYDSAPLQMTTNQPGADPGEVAEFFSYAEGTTTELPNAATLTVPACNVATSLTASVSLDGVELPTTYILFVTDLSYSMGNPLDGTRNRLQVAQDAIADAAEELFDKLGTDAKIGAIGYRGLVRGQCFFDATDSCEVGGQALDSECTNVLGDTCNQGTSGDGTTFFGPEPFDFVGPDGEDDLVDYTYAMRYDKRSAGSTRGTANDGHGTFTHEALTEAKRMFDGIKNSQAGANARYIVILLSDGEVTTDSNYADLDDTQSVDESFTLSLDPIYIADDFDATTGENTAGYEIYGAALENSSIRVENMTNWSSNSYDGQADSFATTVDEHAETTDSFEYEGTAKQTSSFNGLDYAYQAVTEASLVAMYDQIVDSIVEIAVTIVAESNGNVRETSGSIEEGPDVQLPWPTNFVCDDTAEQQVPIQISFPGIGKVELSNVRLNYCAP